MNANSHLKRRVFSAIMLFVFSGVSFLADGAEPYTETFGTGLSGWVHQGSGTLGVSGEAVRFAFGIQGTPIPETASVIVGEAASASAFVGDYLAPRIEVIGFDFLAENQLPSTLKLEWQSGTNVYFRNLKHYITATGVWHTIVVSIADRSADSWIGVQDKTCFPGSLQSVGQVAIRVARSGVAAQVYRLDNVFVDSAPAPASFAVASNGSVAVEWTQLRPSLTYRLQASDALDAAWTNVAVFDAAGWTDAVLDAPSSANQIRFYRLIQEEVHAP